MISKINLNDNVKVYLTEAGLQTLIGYYSRFHSYDNALSMIEFNDLNEPVLHTQLWILFSIFQLQINPVAETQFKNNEIILT